MLIYLDTSNDKSVIKLFNNDGSFADKRELSSNMNLTEELLAKMDDLVSSNADLIEGIFINTGKNSYTGMRVGMTAINFLGLSLDIQPIEVDGEAEIVFSGHAKFAKVVLPSYKNEPFITTKKSRL